MSRTTRIILLGLSATFAGLQALAQGPTGPAAPPAANAAYNSAFEGYRPFAAEEIQDWRRSNDTVREIGGWRAYGREISGGQGQGSPSVQPGAATSVAPAPEPKPTQRQGEHHR